MASMAKYGPKWLIMVQHGQLWSDMANVVKFVLILSAKNSKVWQVWQNMPQCGKNGQVLPVIVQYGQLWPSMTNYDQLLPSMANCSQIWLNIAKYSQMRNMTKYVPIWPIIVIYIQLWPSLAFYSLLLPEMANMTKFGTVWWIIGIYDISKYVLVWPFIPVLPITAKYGKCGQVFLNIASYGNDVWTFWSWFDQFRSI